MNYETDKNKLVKVTCLIDAELHHRLRVATAEAGHGVSMAVIMRNALAEWLAARTKNERED